MLGHIRGAGAEDTRPGRAAVHIPLTPPPHRNSMPLLVHINPLDVCVRYHTLSAPFCQFLRPWALWTILLLLEGHRLSPP